MKLILFILSFFIIASIFSQNKDAKAILKKSMLKCQKLENGYYEANYAIKSFDNFDTIVNNGKIYFDKNKTTHKLSGLKLEEQKTITYASDDKGYFYLSWVDSSYIFADTNVWRSSMDFLFFPYLNPKQGFFK